MRITFIIATLNSGGAERVLVSLANAFSNKHEVSIIKLHANDCFYELKDKIKLISLTQFSFHTPYHKIISRLKKYLALRQALRRSEADIFISFLDTTNIACIFAKMGLKTPLIISEHSNQAYLKSKFWRLLRRLSYRFCDALTVLGSADRTYYENFVKRVELLYNPCHFSAQLSLNEDFKKDNVVLFIGRLDQNKNALMFLEAIAYLDKKFQKDYEFIVLGDGHLREELELKASSLGIEPKFLGCIKKVEDLYRRAKVLCLCSFMEALPMVLIETLYFEVCRISSSYRGVEDLICDNYDGFLVDFDALALARKLEFVLNNEQLRKKIVTNAKRRARDFELCSIEHKWLKLISELTNA